MHRDSWVFFLQRWQNNSIEKEVFSKNGGDKKERNKETKKWCWNN
jgi:hypothetical protein